MCFYKYDEVDIDEVLIVGNGKRIRFVRTISEVFCDVKFIEDVDYKEAYNLAIKAFTFIDDANGYVRAESYK